MITRGRTSSETGTRSGPACHSFRVSLRPLLRPLVGVATLAVAVIGLPATSPTSATAATAYIEPGVQMITAGAQCTANFVFRDKLGRTYVGYAAHCAGLGDASDTDGCRTASLPLNTRVRFAHGVSLTSEGTTVGYGRLAYSSWTAMKRAKITGARCQNNDFALVRVEPAYVKRVRSSVPGWGGPTVLGAMPAAGSRVFTYGSSSLRGLTGGSLSTKSGTIVSRTPWRATVYTTNPGVPGDSGSGFLDADGRAIGVLSTLNIAPSIGSNGVGSVTQQVKFARLHGMPTLRLVPGTVAFKG